jgi:hypothetical protein
MDERTRSPNSGGWPPPEAPPVEFGGLAAIADLLRKADAQGYIDIEAVNVSENVLKPMKLRIKWPPA